MSPDITAFFDEATNTVSYVVRDPAGSACAVIDSVLDFDYASGRTDTSSADRIIAHAPKAGGKSKGEGSILGGLGRLLDGD